MSTDLVVLANEGPNLTSVRGHAAPPPGGSTFVSRFLMLAFAGAALGTGAFLASRFADAATSIAEDNVRVANVKRSGFFEDIVEGRLINEGSGAEIYLWVEWKGEPGCARHTYLRKNSEYQFSFLCSRLTLNNGGELSVFSSHSPPDWVRRTAVSL